MTQVYLNVEEGTIAINNKFYYNQDLDLSFVPKNVKQVIWNGKVGEIEYTNNKIVPISSLKDEQLYIDTFNEIKNSDPFYNNANTGFKSPIKSSSPVIEDYPSTFVFRAESELNPILEPEKLPEPPPLTEKQIEERFRKYRNNFLRDSDWTQGLDSPLSENEKEMWRIYRQELRDLPATIDSSNWPLMIEDLENDFWPAKPV